MRQVSPFTVEAEEVTPRGSRCPLGAKAIYVTQLRGSALAIPVVYTAAGWKVDVRFWLAAKKQAGAQERSSDPEMIARKFLFFLLAKKPEKLGELAAEKINGEDYTGANHLPPGDLDQILSLCLEMPIVRARVGESFRMPSGEIVRADKQPDTVVLVGLLGVAEVAFQLKLVGGEWKIVPRKYFEMLRGIGAI